MGLFGKSSQEKAAEKNIKLQNAYADKRHGFDKRQTRRQNRYNRKSVDIARTNEKVFREFGDAERKQEYQDLLKIRNFEYQQQVRQFNESERIYGLQRQFNSQAANLARAAEARRFEEITAGMAFEQQDMLVKMLQEQGNVQATGQAGKSMGKTLGSVLAGYGRNQAIMAESLLSAQRDSRGNYRQIEQDKYGADLNADARRMLQPLRAPDPTAPMALPTAVIQNAYKLRTPPKAPNQVIGKSSPGFGDFLSTGLKIASIAAPLIPGVGPLVAPTLAGLSEVSRNF